MEHIYGWTGGGHIRMKNDNAVVAAREGGPRPSSFNVIPSVYTSIKKTLLFRFERRGYAHMDSIHSQCARGGSPSEEETHITTHQASSPKFDKKENVRWEKESAAQGMMTLVALRSSSCEVCILFFFIIRKLERQLCSKTLKPLRSCYITPGHAVSPFFLFFQW